MSQFKSTTKWIALLVILMTASACGNLSNEDLIFLAAIPTANEVELVVQLGKDLEPVFMAVGCDTTDRTIQAEAKSKGSSWREAKGFPGAAVVGTWIPYEFGEYDIGLTVNGELRQSSNTSLMVHSVNTLIAALSEKENLTEGDLIFTGTPAGVGSLTPGDEVKAWLKDDKEARISYFSATCE